MISLLRTPLVSVIVLSYRNVEYLNSCLDSIFTQTYSNIELIVSNDGAEEFDESAVNEYVSANRKDNIRKAIVNKNPQNYGTVRHCNVTLDMSSGEYIMFIACDDTYNNDNAVKDMVEGFSIVPSNAMSIVSQTGMYDNEMRECMHLFVTEETQKLINELSPYELYRNYLVYLPLMPAASRIYKREAFEKYGKFDEKYFLVEDVTSSISHAKQGMKTYYLDIMCVNHRDGGVSHSKLNPNSFAQRMYHKDLITLWEDVLTDKDALSDDIRRKVELKLLHHNKLLNRVEGNSAPVVSLIVLSYKNVEYLHNCLNSIFIQTYSNIELIISNDGADEFDETAVADYVNKHKGENIKNLIINKNERNFGTVKHSNIALNLSSGEFIMFIGCDDEYFDEQAVEDIVVGFKVVPSDVMSIIGQTRMCNGDLSKVESYFVTVDIQNQINKLTPYEFYKDYLAIKCVLPAAGRVYKKEVFEKFGAFDEKFFIIEDWTSSISFARQGMRTYYLEVLCVNHRDGGVSHSQFDTNNFAQKMYALYHINLAKSLLDHKDEFSKESIKIIENRKDFWQQAYDRTFVVPLLSPGRRKLYIFKTIVKEKLPRLAAKLPKWALKKLSTLNFFTLFVFFSIIYVLNHIGITSAFMDSSRLEPVIRYFIFACLIALALKKLISAFNAVYQRVKPFLTQYRL